MKLLKILLFILIMLLASSRHTEGQETKYAISGIVLRDQSIPAEGATVVIQQASDSAFVKGVMVDTTGKFVLPNMNTGHYLIVFSMIGYQREYRDIAISSDMTIGTIELKEQISKLDEVYVLGKRQQLTIQPDRLVFRPSELSSQSSVMDLLHSLPGVVVNGEGEISLNGDRNVIVMIDGRKQSLSGAALQNLLQSMQGNNVDCIEVIEHPSVEMEAGGSAGIIQINRRRGSYKGESLYARVKMQQGLYTSGGASLGYNYQDKRFTVSIDGNYYRQNGFHILTIDKLYPDKTVNDTAVTCWQQPNQTINADYYYISGSVDYNLSNDAYIGIYGRYNYDERVESGHTTSKFFTGNNCDSMLYYTYDGDQTNTSILSTGVYYVHKDTLHREFKAFADYVYYDMDAAVNQDLTFSDFLKNKNVYSALNSTPMNIINIYSGQIDYSMPLSRALKVSLGGRTNYTDLSQGVSYWKELSGRKEIDYEISNRIDYKEWISGVYMQASFKAGKKIKGNIGVRTEYTDINGVQGNLAVGNDSVFSNSYMNWFPGLSVQYEFNESNIFTFQYNKRINRPGFKQLSPYVKVFDEYTYEKGNSKLKPEIQHQLSLSYTINKSIRLSLGYAKSIDVIIKNFERGMNNRMYILPQNLSGAYRYECRLDLFGLSPVKWWDYNLTVRGIHSNFSYYVDGISETHNSNNVYVQMSNKLSLPWNIKFELTGYYYSGSYQGLAWAKPQYEMWGNIGKSICKNKGFISIYARDIFDTNRDAITIKHFNLEAKANNRNGDNQFGIAFTWKISNGKDIKKKNPGTSENEAKRLGI